MSAHFFTIGSLMLLSAMLPGPDFAMVTKNTLFYNRRAGIFTSLGVSVAILIHISYCLLGLALVISKSILIFNIIKYIGAAYLFYLGISALLAKSQINSSQQQHSNHINHISDITAFRQGLLCNLLNPKATLFFLALFTVMIKPGTSLTLELAYALEMFLIIAAWFCSLTFILSHPLILHSLHKAEKYISKMLGLFLIGFGVVLVLVQK